MIKKIHAGSPHSSSSPSTSFLLERALPSSMLLLLQPSASPFPFRPNSSNRLIFAGGNCCHHRLFSLGTPHRFLSVVAAATSPGDVDTFTKYSGYLFENGVSSEAEFLDYYDLRSIAAIYRRKPLLVLRRFVQIGTTFGRWFVVRYIDRLLERSDEMFKVSLFYLSLKSKAALDYFFDFRSTSLRPDSFFGCLQIRASELRLLLLELGPVCFTFRFIFFCQGVVWRASNIYLG